MAFAKKYSLLPALFLTSCLLACNNDDLKKVSSISVKKITLSKDRSYDVEIIYSDSAKVKAKGTAPVLDKVTPSSGNAYSEMPKGLNIIFFDDHMNQSGSLRSDYAINKETDKITIFRKNVALVSDNITFTTDELTWNENTRMYTSPYGTVKWKDGSTISGTHFSAPQDFSSYKIVEASGKTYLDGQLAP